MNLHYLFADIIVIYNSLKYLHSQLNCELSLTSHLTQYLQQEHVFYLDFSIVFNEKRNFFKNVNLDFFPQDCQPHVKNLQSFNRALSKEEAQLIFLIFQRYDILKYKEDTFIEALQKIISTSKKNPDNAPYFAVMENYLLGQNISDNNYKKTTFKV